MKITDALVAEHTIFLIVFDQIERALPDLTSPAEIRTMANIIEGVLREHASREANLAYLALDHMLADQGHLERMHQEHDEIDSALKKVRRSGDCAEGRRLLKASLRAAREHFRLEEQTLFPMLEQVLQPETLTQLGRYWLERDLEPANA